MLTRFVLAIILTCSTLLCAEDSTPGIAEPQYVNQFFVLSANGQLTPLEREPMHHAIKRKNIPLIKVNIESRQDVDGGPASPVHVGATPHFVVKMMTGEIDPTTLMHLVQLKVDKQGRYYVTGDNQAFIYTNGKSTGPQGDAAQLRITKYGQSSLEVQPAQPLPAGEYALIINPAMVDCFSVDPALTSSMAGANQGAAPASAKAEPPVWKLKPVQHPQAITDVYEATLAGAALSGGKHGAAQLDVTCTVNHFTGPAGTDASLSSTLKVRREMVAFPVDELSCEGDGAYGAPFLRSQLGADQEQRRNLCFDGELGSDPRAVLSLGLAYDEPVVSAIFQASGEPLTLKIRPQDGSPDALTASFQLPANGAEILTAFDACVKIEQAKRRKEADAIVVACPVIPDKTLANVDVLIGPAMKKLTPDPENDIGKAWDMPKATKTHPTMPKMTLGCSYKDGSAGAADPTASAQSAPVATTKKLLPIPNTAKSCVFRVNEYTNEPYGNCSRE